MEQKTEFSHNRSLSDRTCPICQNKFESLAWSCRKCSGEFHFLCIVEWLMVKYNCPCCRANKTPIVELRVSEENVLTIPSSHHDFRLWILYLRLLIYQISVETSFTTIVTIVTRLTSSGFNIWLKLFSHLFTILLVAFVLWVVTSLLNILLGPMKSLKDFFFNILRLTGRSILSTVQFLFLWPLYLYQAVKATLWSKFQRLFKDRSQKSYPDLQSEITSRQQKILIDNRGYIYIPIFPGKLKITLHKIL